MALFTVVLFIGVIILAILALKFLVGLVRTVVSIALFIIAAALLVYLLTGNDLLGVGPTMSGVVNTVNDTVQNISIPQITP